MKVPPRRFLVLMGALLSLLLVFWLSGGFQGFPQPPRLAVGFVTVESDPFFHPMRGPTVLNGAAGLCAIFAVTNAGKDTSVWFDTCAVEQNVGTEWRRTPVLPYALRVTEIPRIGETPWVGITSDSVNNNYPPGTAWYYVVEWPPGVPTNACWRLELRYGAQPSPKAQKLDDALGVRLFSKRGRGETLLTPEVRP
jgi:hypothetical protein